MSVNVPYDPLLIVLSSASTDIGWAMTSGVLVVSGTVPIPSSTAPITLPLVVVVVFVRGLGVGSVLVVEGSGVSATVVSILISAGGSGSVVGCGAVLVSTPRGSNAGVVGVVGAAVWVLLGANLVVAVLALLNVA